MTAMRLIIDRAAVRGPFARAVPGKAASAGLADGEENRLLLHPFRFIFRPGLYALLGPNGSGKSTLLRLLAGIVDPSEGSVKLVEGGKELSFPSLKRRIGYVPQEIAVYDEMTAFAYLRYVATMKLIPASLIPDRIADVAAQFGLSDILPCRISSLSTGTKKLLTLAQSVLTDPDLLLVDELLETLDPEALRKVTDYLQRCTRYSITLLATHRLDVLPYLADKILFLYRGRLIGAYDPDEIRKRYASFEHFYMERIESARTSPG